MVLKPQDVLVVLKLVAMGQRSWSYAWLAEQLGMSPSQLHAAVKRALVAQLAVRKGDAVVPDVRNLEEFLVHGLKYVFLPEQGEMTRGIPTGYAAPPLNKHFVSTGEPPPVWPDAEGDVRGISFSPLYKSVPKAAKDDPELYALLALVDAIRGGRARERDEARAELHRRLAATTAGKGDMAMSDMDTIVIGKTIEVPRTALQELARRYHIHRIVLFGSAARGELGPASDIDLLVEFESGKAPSLGGMVEIQEVFAKLFGGRKVDVATPAILNNPYRRRAIEKDMEELYAA